MSEITIVPIIYEKSSQHRVVVADGVYGGPDNAGRIDFTFWNERGALPREAQMKIVAGKAEEKIVGGSAGLTREAEVTVTMGLEAAMAFHAWLGQHIGSLQAMRAASRPEGVTTQ